MKKNGEEEKLKIVLFSKLEIHADNDNVDDVVPSERKKETLLGAAKQCISNQNQYIIL